MQGSRCRDRDAGIAWPPSPLYAISQYDTDEKESLRTPHQRFLFNDADDFGGGGKSGESNLV